jgi:hypothetical protein
MSETAKVLLLAADHARGAAGLRLDREVQAAVEAARRGGAVLEVRSELAASRDEIMAQLLRHDPQIIHFSAHGRMGRYLEMDDGSRVGPDDLPGLVAHLTNVRLVVLNACGVLELGKALSAVVDYTVAMELPIGDDAAIHFTNAFYTALAFGRTVQTAFDMARVSTVAGYGEASGIPHLLVRPGARPWTVPQPPKADAKAAVPESGMHNRVRDIQGEGPVSVENKDGGQAAGGMGRMSNDVEGIRSGGAVRIGNTRS